MNYKEYFKGKKITMLGLGLLGRGLNDARFLAECGADLLITDLKTKEQLQPTLDKLKKYKNIKYVLGEHKLEDFRQRDFILKAAGVPLDSIYLAEARKNNIPIEMDESLFAKLAPEVKIIGITGTRGKSTTTYLIYEILKKYFANKVFLGLNSLGKTVGRKTFLPKVFLGGNIKGLATLPLLKKVKAGDIVVMELSSWQLQGFGEAKISPHLSVFTNLLPDHLNYYLKVSKDEKEAVQKYFTDKAQIYLNQKAGDYLICGTEIAKKIGKIKSNKIISDCKVIPKSWKIKIPGEHNLKNIACAIEICRALGLPMNAIRQGVESFVGVEGRLEFIREYKGIKIYNDTNSTTPDATLVALRALAKNSDMNKKKVILIFGGADKSLDMSKLIKEIPKVCKKAFLLKGTGTDKLKIDYCRQTQDIVVFEILKKAVVESIKNCQKGDILLFSPAFASFGMFKNEYDRGDKFVKIIKNLK